MPGAYTHLSIARLLISRKALDDLNLPPEARSALLEYPEFCQMGALSPDYPYLNLMIGKEASEHWANAMHHKYGTATKHNILHMGIGYLRELAGEEQSRCLAWFLGYASHVTADVTCHPVTNLLVGDYEAGNQVAHRVSELHQDVYIFSKRLTGDVSKSEQIQNVVGICSDPDDKNKVEPSIENMWRNLLSRTFPDIAAEFEIDIHDWHSSTQLWLEDIAEELSWIPSRHIREFLTGKGVSYPRPEDIDRTYIDELDTPDGKKSYDEIFNYAKDNVGKVWQLITKGIFLGDSDYIDKLRIWNLDTGQEVITPKVLWEGSL